MSRIFRSYLSDGKTLRAKQVDLAAELGIPNVPRGESSSTKGIPFVTNLETKKAGGLLGLTPVAPLKDLVAIG